MRDTVTRSRKLDFVLFCLLALAIVAASSRLRVYYDIDEKKSTPRVEQYRERGLRPIVRARPW